MSDLLSIGATGLRAYQTALTTVSENIANATTPGYSRRSTTLREITAVSSATAVAAQTGNGVAVVGIARAADDLNAVAIRAAGSDLARTQASVTVLDRIETALAANTLPDSLTAFFNTAKAVAADPTATTPRAALIEAGVTLANAFTITGGALDQALADLDSVAVDSVTQINGIAESLGRVNNGLGRVQPGSSAAAQLLDQRDQLLAQLSALSTVTVATDDLGRATVRLGDASGPVLLVGDVAGFVAYDRTSAGTVSYTVARAGALSAVTPTGGALAGIVDGAQRIVGATIALDQIAVDFTQRVNAVQAQGRDLDGNPGIPFFATGATPTDLSVTITDPRAIAAAAAGGGPRDNRNLAALESARQTDDFENRLIALISSNASALSARRAVAEAQTTIRDGAVAARDAVSGVNLDAEGVELLRFQQAFQASSRVIQAAQDILQTLFNLR